MWSSAIGERSPGSSLQGETVLNIERWNRHFEQHADLIFHGRTAADVDEAIATNRTAIFFGCQTPSPIEDDIGLVEIVHALSVRFMQLTYNNQSLLATGCYEAEDAGLTRMGKEVIREMNRVGLVVEHESFRRSVDHRGRGKVGTSHRDHTRQPIRLGTGATQQEAIGTPGT